MIFFCENCGSKLPADARFCENCGCVACKEDITNTKSKNTPENYNIFSYDDWKEATEEARKQMITDSGKGTETNGK